MALLSPLLRPSGSSSSGSSSSRSSHASGSSSSARPCKRRPLAHRALRLAATAVAVVTLAATSVAAQRQTGGFEVVQPNSGASAMMLVLVNEQAVAIIDKVEGNPSLLNNGKPTWGTIMDLTDNSIRAVDISTNTFCASGAHLGNGSLVVAGGNQAVQEGGAGLTAGVLPQNSKYQDYDGRKALRIMEHGDTNGALSWNDNSNFMRSSRWYPGIETLTDGSILLIGGAVGGGYINRNTPVVDQFFQTLDNSGGLDKIDVGGANPTWEFFPDKGNPLQIMQFLGTTGGLNMYPHTFLMPSGQLFLQANITTILWDWNTNVERRLADMPGNVVRVYPASGATAMLPLTPKNNYTPTILFCGGSVLTDQQWGNYTAPQTNVMQITASKDCSSITPESADGDFLAPDYVHEEDLPEGRTMGQFIHLPDGTMVIVNGANKGTAGYSNETWTFNQQGIRTEGMAADPTYQPVLYDPAKPLGSRLSRDGLGTSKIARLYHSTAILIPDGSVLIAGSNPHQDVSTNMPLNSNPQAFNTTYEVEKFYPAYYFKMRPQPTGLPTYILYGGNPWTFKMDSGFMNEGSAANFRAQNTKIMVIRPGFSTHAMNMGQRSLQLDHSYTVNDDGSVDFTVMPMPQNQNIFVAGPALLFVTIDGVPSSGKYVQIGSRTFSGPVPTTYNTGKNPTLPASRNSTAFTATPKSDSSSSFGVAKLAGIAAGGAAVLALILLGLCLWRRRANRKPTKGSALGRGAAAGATGGAMYGMSSYASGGPEYKRVDTPQSAGMGHFAMGGMPGARASMGTFDSYGNGGAGVPPRSPGFAPSGPGTPTQQYYDAPARSGSSHTMAPSPLAGGASLGAGAAAGGAAMGAQHSQEQYAQHGWGEHQAGGDVGEEYYRDAGYSDPQRYYDPQPQPGSGHAPYGSQGYSGQSAATAAYTQSPSSTTQPLAPHQQQHQQSYSQQHDYFRSES